MLVENGSQLALLGMTRGCAPDDKGLPVVMDKMVQLPEWAGMLIAAAMFATLFSHMLGA